MLQGSSGRESLDAGREIGDLDAVGSVSSHHDGCCIHERECWLIKSIVAEVAYQIDARARDIMMVPCSYVFEWLIHQSMTVRNLLNSRSVSGLQLPLRSVAAGRRVCPLVAYLLE